MPPRREAIPEPTTSDMIFQFNKLKPQKFQGGADTLRYEEWKRKLENLFEIMECPDRFKVALTTYQFEGEAEFWWGTVKPRGDGGEPSNIGLWSSGQESYTCVLARTKLYENYDTYRCAMLYYTYPID